MNAVGESGTGTNMATTNHERVGKALDLLKAGLGPFVDREVQAAVKAQRVNPATLRRFVDDPLDVYDRQQVARSCVDDALNVSHSQQVAGSRIDDPLNVRDRQLVTRSRIYDLLDVRRRQPVTHGCIDDLLDVRRRQLVACGCIDDLLDVAGSELRTELGSYCLCDILGRLARAARDGDGKHDC